MDIGTRPHGATPEIGALLRAERERAALTQTELARRAGVSQGTVSAVERGVRRPSLTVIAQLLGAVDRQLLLGTDPLDQPEAELDAAIAALSAMSPAERLRTGHFDGVALLRLLAPVAPVVGGAAAAVLHGAPVPCSVLEVAVEHSRLAALADLIRTSYAERWNEVWERFDMAAPDPRLSGPPRWQLLDGEFRVELVNERPTAVTVLVDELAVAVRPLHEVAVTDRRVRRALARLPAGPAP